MPADLRTIARDAFGVTPDTRFLFLSRSHGDAIASLKQGIDCDRPFIALVGPPGSGKTTLLFHLLQHYRNSARTAFVFQTQCNSRELLEYLLTDCGIDCAGHDIVMMHSRFNQLLVDTHRVGKRFLLFLDEAQNFTNETLEAIRLLSDFETPQKKLLQIIFSGQPAIETTLSAPAMQQLRQRIPLFCRLEPLTRDETGDYIEHRLKIVGAMGRELFQFDAVGLIYEVTSGVPRDIHNVCFASLSLAGATESETVKWDLVCEAAKSLGLNAAESEAKKRAAAIAHNDLWSTAERPFDVAHAAGSAVAYHASRAASLSNASEATTGFSDLFEKKDDIQVQAAIDDASAVPETPKDTFQTPKNTEFLKSEGGADAGMPVAETLRELLVEKQEATSNKKYKADKKKGTKGALLLVAAAGVLLLIAIFTLTPAAEQFGFSRNLIAAAQSTVKNSTKNLAGTLLPAEPAVEPTAAPASQPVEAPKAQKKTTPKKRQDVRPKDSNIPWVRTSSVTVSIADNRPSEPAPQVTSMNPGETTTDEVLAAAMTPLENHGMNVQARSQVVPSRLLESPAPKYPEMAEKAGITGEVDLGAVIGTDGKLKNIQVIKGHPLLNDAAIEAARGQRYSPYLLNSIPQEIPTRIRFVFKR